MRKSLFVGALIGAIALTSCDTEHESRATVPYPMVNYTVTPSGEAYSTGYSSFTFNYTSPEESGIRIEGLDFAGANTKIYDFKNLTLKEYTDRYTMEANNLTTPMPSSLKSTVIGNNNVNYKISIEGNSILGLGARQFLYSATVVSNVATGEQIKRTEDEKNQYTLIMQSKDINTPKRALNVYINSAAFMDGMPTINMVFKDVCFEFKNGILVFSRDELIPEKVNSANLENTVPQERFKITELSGNLVPGGEGVVSFICNYENKDGVVIPFRVQSVLKNYVKIESTPKN